jgi:uncharacterized circularly permuted ATP-grasp superfamily protein/uncharacterized alpha-E superfamily protein
MPTPLDPLQTQLLETEPPDPAQLAAQASLRARDGHWDELWGGLTEAGEAPAAMAPLWQRFWRAGGLSTWQELDARAARIARRVQEDGASYNVYASADGEGPSSSHVWPLELLPLLVDTAEWRQIEAGVRQRAQLLNSTLADLYGERRLLSRGLLPASLVLAHPQYLRPLQGCQPPGGVFLHVVAFDLARGPDGQWWVVAQRTQAPSGLGYMLENRLINAEAFPDAFRALGIQRLASSFRTLLQGLVKLAPVAPGESCRVALLTPGPHNETYFEHAFLARYLGISLVEGGDLTVRDNRVYLKTLRGLERLHVLLRRVDDEYLDPLELRADSQLGVPGLVQALRAKQVLLANAPGAGWLESPGLSAFWPGVAKSLLGEDLLLPSGDGWWCGEASAWADCRERLAEFVVAPTFPSSETTRGFAPFLAGELDPAELMLLAARIDADPTAHTLKERLRPSMQPVWRGGLLEPRAAVLRVFAVCDGQGGWTVLPGGLTRVAQSRGSGGPPDALLSMQAGCASVDTWVQAEGAVDRSSLLPPPLQASDLSRAHRTVTSRAAENLFWLGRYTERCENSLRLARLTLGVLAAGGSEPLLRMLDRAARQHGLLPIDAEPTSQAPRRFEQQLLQRLGDAQAAGSLAWNLQALAGCAQALRERLSTPHWQLIQRLGDDFASGLLQAQAQTQDIDAVLATTDQQLSALTGAQTDRMTRDDGWRLLSVGRQIERLHFHSDLLQQGFAQQLPRSDEGFALLLALFDSTITYRAQFQDRREVAPLLHLLVMDSDNPRALAWVARTLRDRFLKLARHDPDWAGSLAAALPDPEHWALAPLLRTDTEGEHRALQELLQHCSQAALQLSTEIGRHLFAHVAAPERRVWQ